MYFSLLIVINIHFLTADRKEYLFMGICGANCESCKIKNECNGCSMCEASICKKYCCYCDALCPNRYGNAKYSFEILNSLNSNYKLNGNKKIWLPKFIPGLPDKINVDIDLPLVALDGDKFLSSDGRNIAKRFTEVGIHEAMGLKPESKVLLHFYIKDRKLNGLWLNRKELYKKLKQFNFYGIISPNFSVYEDAPRMDHLYNIKKNIQVYNEMIENNLPTIPDVNYYSVHDLKRWCHEINKSNIRTVSFSLQVVDVRLKASNTWKHYIAGLRYFRRNTSPEVNIIIPGISSHRRYSNLKEAAAGHDISIISKTPYLQSTKGILSETGKKMSNLSKSELFILNFKYYNELK
jgi:hypothetical protein